MTTAEALLLLTTQSVTDPDSLPCCDDAKADWVTPISLAALAELSGALPDAHSWDALKEAVEHGLTLVSADIVSIDDWFEATRRVAIVAMEDGNGP